MTIITTLHWNELLAIALTIGLILYVAIGLVVTNPNRKR
jgi:hypothetical protein